MSEAEEADWPRGTLAVSAAILLVYFAESAVGLDDPQRTATLVRAGAVGYAAVFEGHEWWRLLAASFCHYNLPHLLVNGWALIQVGALVEDIYGRERFLAVYLLSCLGSSLATSSIGTFYSVGASGGIMGLLGFLIAARYVHERELRDYLRDLLGRQLVFWAALILALGALLSALADHVAGVPRVDNYGHLGGLLTGLALTLPVRGTAPPRAPLRLAALALAALAVVSLAFVAARGDESARIERAYLDTIEGRKSGDAAAVASGLAALRGVPPRRVVGRDVRRAIDLVSASIAAVRTEDALAYGALAAELDPDRGGGVHAAARVAFFGDPESRAALERYRKSAPLRELVELGSLFERLGRDRHAAEFFEEALAKAPEDPLLLNDLAWTLLKDGFEGRDVKRALLLARRAQAKLPDDAAVLDTLAKAEFENGQVEQALQHQERAVQIALKAGDPQAAELVERLQRFRSAAK